MAHTKDNTYLSEDRLTTFIREMFIEEFKKKKKKKKQKNLLKDIVKAYH